MSTIIGLDPGKAGALVALDEAGRLVAAHAAEDSFCPGEYRPAEMARLLGGLAPTLVILERQHAMPKQGLTSTFSIGRGFGLWEGVVAALELPLHVVTSSVWQRAVLRGVPGEGKVRAVIAAEARVPELVLTPGRRRKPHDGLADAACLALYGLSVAGRLEAAA